MGEEGSAELTGADEEDFLRVVMDERHCCRWEFGFGLRLCRVTVPQEWINAAASLRLQCSGAVVLGGYRS